LYPTACLLACSYAARVRGRVHCQCVQLRACLLLRALHACVHACVRRWVRARVGAFCSSVCVRACAGGCVRARRANFVSNACHARRGNRMGPHFLFLVRETNLGFSQACAVLSQSPIVRRARQYTVVSGSALSRPDAPRTQAMTCLKQQQHY
jgi:hypothetical protein